MTPIVSGAVAESELRALLAPKKNVKRSCDACRRRKVRCDGDEITGTRCSSCSTYRLECTYLEAPKKRAPEAYVRYLERRLEQMERLLRTKCPNTNFSEELSGAVGMDKFMTMGQPHVQSTPSTRGYTPDGDDELPSSDDEFTTFNLTKRRLPISRGTTTSFGKSSSAVLIHAAVEMKKEFHNPDGSSVGSVCGEARSNEHFPPNRRPKFWRSEPWGVLKNDALEPHYKFPDPDLLPSLVDNYFTHMNLIFPLLHRPTFEQSLADDLHLRDAGFGGVVLLVAAVGAGFSSDPRVCAPGNDPVRSVGYTWFRQVQAVLRPFYVLPSLYDLQIYCLSAMFLLGLAASESWVAVGIGIRLSQAVGVHRKRVYEKTPTVVDELWKRAFWVLVALDRFCSSALGRPCATQVEDFDLEFPAECDDEYWTATTISPAFTQPPGKPSKISFFVSYLKLSHILATTLRTIYSIKKPKFAPTLIGGEQEKKIVTELDSALNEWHDSVPDHLRWNPHHEDTEFLQQSAVLYACYYDLQISAHKPFVSSSQKPSALSFPSLAICINAARSCSHLTEFSRERLGPILHHLTLPTFTAGVVLLFNIWGGKWAGMNIDPTKEVEDVHRCISALGMAEKSWHPAGRLWDILYGLAYVGNLSLSHRITGHPDGLQRELDGPLSAYASSPVVGEHFIISSHRGSGTKKETQRQSMLREHHIPPPGDFQESTHMHDLGDSPRRTAMGETTAAPSPSTAELREQPQTPTQGQYAMDQGGHETAIIPARDVPMDADVIGAPLFPIDPTVYGNMIDNFSHAGAFTSEIGQQVLRNLLDSGSSDIPLGQGGLEPRPQTQQQYANPPVIHGDGRSGNVQNSEGLTMRSNTLHGPEWEDWVMYARSFSNMTIQNQDRLET